MSKYAQGESTVKEVRNAEFLKSIGAGQPNSSAKPQKKSRKK